MTNLPDETERTQQRQATFDQDIGHRYRLTAIAALRGEEPRVPKTHVAHDVSPPRTTHVFRRGEFSQPADAVAASVPAVLRAPAHGHSETPNRLGFARWLVAPEQPLTARVIVNRVWQQYFGLGLVATEDNFGISGDPPSHPELLDWLATTFVAEGWSLKKLHRQIVESAVYRQSSHVRPDLTEIDPQNRLLARQTRLRLEAESIRDAALAVSGLLSRKLGGPSVYPYQPDGVLTGRATPAAWVVSQGEDRHRRGMYTYYWRLTPHPFLRLFDAPDSTAACTRRTRSNTPVQALTLLNDPMFLECAEALADRLRRDVPQDEPERIRQAFRLCLGRNPSVSEFQKAERFLRQPRPEAGDTGSPETTGSGVRPDSQPRRHTEWVGLTRALLNLDEFITRE